MVADRIWIWMENVRHNLNTSSDWLPAPCNLFPLSLNLITLWILVDYAYSSVRRQRLNICIILVIYLKRYWLKSYRAGMRRVQCSCTAGFICLLSTWGAFYSLIWPNCLRSTGEAWGVSNNNKLLKLNGYKCKLYFIYFMRSNMSNAQRIGVVKIRIPVTHGFKHALGMKKSQIMVL